MKSTTKAIILKRVNFSESDRILTLLTPESGKLRAIAKGVRKQKSKLAGGLELLSVSQIGYIKGRGELLSIVSTRLIKHYENIVTDYDRVKLAYLAIEMVDGITEDDAGEEYFDYLTDVFEELDDLKNNLNTVELWLRMQILAIFGNLPNLSRDCDGKSLEEGKTYRFDPEDGCFRESNSGGMTSDHIKSWRVLVGNRPSKSRQIKRLNQMTDESIDDLRLFSRNILQIG